MRQTLFANPAIGRDGGRRLAAVWLAPLLALALWAGEAAAQSSVQVSNAGQTASGSGSLDTHDVAQKFTTGTNDGGFTLTSVEVRLTATGGTGTAAPRVIVVRNAPTAVQHFLVATLTASTASITANTPANYTFTAPANTALRPSTDYWVVVEAAPSGGGDVDVIDTASGSEDATPATGWSIDDEGLQRAHDDTGTFVQNANSYMIRVNGSTRTNSPATGQPGIAGSAIENLPLRVLRGTVADLDGLPGDYDFQWIRVVGTDETDIPGFTSNHYRLGADDVGNRVKVRLSFIDNAGNMESRTSAPSGTVQAAPHHGIAGEALVGNLEQPRAVGDFFGSYDLAQKFTTGPNAGGYTLTGIQLRLGCQRCRPRSARGESARRGAGGRRLGRGRHAHRPDAEGGRQHLYRRGLFGARRHRAERVGRSTGWWSGTTAPTRASYRSR